jgi:hypothetical protein
MSETQGIAVNSSLKKRGRPVKGPYSAPTLLVASQKHLHRETLRSVLAKKPAKKINIRSILDKYPGAKISSPKYSITVPFNALDNLPNKQVEPISNYSLALIINLI